MNQHAEYIGPASAKAAFTNKDTHPLILDLLLAQAFGKEHVGWDPATVWTAVQRTWATPVSEACRNKIHAIRVCRSTDTPYTQWPVFENVAAGLFGITPNLDVLQRPSPMRCAAAIDIMTQVRAVPFSPEVYRYVGACLLDHGVAYAPGAISAVNQYTAPIVSSSLQNRIEAAVGKGVTPTFNGENEDDAQIMKSLQISDYMTRVNEILLGQLNTLFSKADSGSTK
jgi:rubredoxin